jgi:AcrR family transcriptional regulator
MDIVRPCRRRYAEPMPDGPAWIPPSVADGGAGKAGRPRGEDTVGRILSAGRACFRTYDYAGTRVDDIVAAAGVSHGAFYLYFRNKEDLLHRMAVECADRIRALAADLEALPRPIDPDDLQSWVARFVAAYHDDGPVIRVWLDNRDPDPLMQSLANDSLGPLAQALAGIVEPSLSAAVDDRLAGLGLLSLLERLSSYLRDVPQDLAAATAAQLIFATTVRSG